MSEPERQVLITAHIAVAKKIIPIPAGCSLAETRRRLFSAVHSNPALHVYNPSEQSILIASGEISQKYQALTAKCIKASLGIDHFEDDDNVPIGLIVSENDVKVNAVIHEGSDASDPIAELMTGNFGCALSMMRGLREHIQTEKREEETKNLAAELQVLRSYLEDEKRCREEEAKHREEEAKHREEETKRRDRETQALKEEIQQERRLREEDCARLHQLREEDCAQLRRLKEEDAQLRQLLDQERQERKLHATIHSVALEQAISHNETSLLHHIRFRDVLNQAQAALANAANLVRKTAKPNPSADWRRTLDSLGDLTAKRQEFARSLLSPAPKNLSKLIMSDDAMSLLCEKVSSFREDGNEAAHPNIASDDLLNFRKVAEGLGDVNNTDDVKQRGILEIIDFLLASSPPKSDQPL